MVTTGTARSADPSTTNPPHTSAAASMSRTSATASILWTKLRESLSTAPSDHDVANDA